MEPGLYNVTWTTRAVSRTDQLVEAASRRRDKPGRSKNRLAQQNRELYAQVEALRREQ